MYALHFFQHNLKIHRLVLKKLPFSESTRIFFDKKGSKCTLEIKETMNIEVILKLYYEPNIYSYILIELMFYTRRHLFNGEISLPKINSIIFKEDLLDKYTSVLSFIWGGGMETCTICTRG